MNKTEMQSIIKNMIAEAAASANPTRVQRTAINRLQLSFFEGF